jgi:hypothetical protein
MLLKLGVNKNIDVVLLCYIQMYAKMVRFDKTSRFVGRPCKISLSVFNMYITNHNQPMSKWGRDMCPIFEKVLPRKKKRTILVFLTSLKINVFSPHMIG